MGFESLVDHARGRGMRRIFRTAGDAPLVIAVRQYESSKHPRLVLSISEVLAALMKLKHKDRADVLFDRDDSTGLIKLRDDGYQLSRPPEGKRFQLQMPFVPVVCPDFGEQGYEPEEVDVKDEGILFSYPPELFRTGRNGIVA